jgi:hypothetical protein
MQSIAPKAPSTLETYFVPEALRQKEGDSSCTKAAKFTAIPFAAIPYALFVVCKKIASAVFSCFSNCCCCKKPAKPIQKPVILALDKSDSPKPEAENKPSPSPSLKAAALAVRAPSNPASTPESEELEVSPRHSLPQLVRPVAVKAHRVHRVHRGHRAQSAPPIATPASRPMFVPEGFRPPTLQRKA